jgi:predicted nucleotidyltransferase
MNKIKEIKSDIIVKTIFGSQLYGTNTKDSDLDYKSIFLPSKEEIFLNKIPKSVNKSIKQSHSIKNIKGDIDIELYSLHYFIKLACDGQTVALDMLHTPDNMVLETSEIWKNIVKERYRFYTKNLKAFIGYAKRQASKYSIKGERLIESKKLLDILNNYKKNNHGDIKLSVLWNLLPEGEYLKKSKNEYTDLNEYEVCGRKVQETASVNYALEVFNKYYENYGKRAKLAEKNEGIDWKAISHCLRVSYELKQILTENTITFPLKEAEFLKDVKQGKLNFKKEVSPLIDNLFEEIEELNEKSNLPKKVDRKYWDNFLINVIEKYIL